MQLSQGDRAEWHCSICISGLHISPSCSLMERCSPAQDSPFRQGLGTFPTVQTFVATEEFIFCLNLSALTLCWLFQGRYEIQLDLEQTEPKSLCSTCKHEIRGTTSILSIRGPASGEMLVFPKAAGWCLEFSCFWTLWSFAQLLGLSLFLSPPPPSNPNHSVTLWFHESGSVSTSSSFLNIRDGQWLWQCVVAGQYWKRLRGTGGTGVSKNCWYRQPSGWWLLTLSGTWMSFTLSGFGTCCFWVTVFPKWPLRVFSFRPECGGLSAV